ncbi:MAG TPA: hypothetical protein VGJ67_03745 [Actinomycetota bacterium]
MAQGAASVPRATARVVGSVLLYRSAPGIDDLIYFGAKFHTGATTTVFLESSNDVRAGPSCVRLRPHLRQPAPYRIRCFDVGSTSFALGDGSDQISEPSDLLRGHSFYSDLPTVVCGGPGADRIIGGVGPATLFGGSGNDEVHGGAESDLLGGKGNDILAEDSIGNARTVGATGATLRGGRGSDSLSGAAADDQLLGGAGDDSLRGGPGADHLIGGPGGDEMTGGGGAHDVIDYSHETKNVQVTDDGVANDGRAGEGDNALPVGQSGPLSGTEIIETGSGNDVVSMHGPQARLIGNGGDDTLTLTGGPGSVSGGRGDDALTISGAPGRMRGGPGEDRLASSDSSPDHDGCGPGTDEVTADAGDVVNTNCESVTIAP